MIPHNVLLFAGQSTLLLAVALVLMFVFRKHPSLRIVCGRTVLLAIAGLAVTSPFKKPQKQPFVAVRAFDFQPVREVKLEPVSKPSPVVESKVAAVSSAELTVRQPQISEPIWEKINPILSVYLLGVIASLASLGLGLYQLRRKRKESVLLSHSQIQETIAEVAKTFGVQVPTTLVSPRFDAPFVVGVTKATLYIPRSWQDQPNKDMIRAVLYHEFAHLATEDLRWMAFHRLLTILFWPQLLLVLLRKPLALASEELCDRYVLANGISDHQYAQYLLEYKANRLLNPTSLSIGIAQSRSGLSKRIEAILDRKRSRSVSISPFVAWGTRVGVIVVACATTIFFASPSPTVVTYTEDLSGWQMNPYSGVVNVTVNGEPVHQAQAHLSIRYGEYGRKYITIPVRDGKLVLPDLKLQGKSWASIWIETPELAWHIEQIWPRATKLTTVQMTRTTRMYRGTLLLPDGKPAKNMYVTPRIIVEMKNSGPNDPRGIIFLKDEDYLMFFSTGKDGHFAFPNLGDNMEVQLEVIDPRYARLGFEDRIKMETKDVLNPKPIRLQSACSVSGKVRLNGKPVLGMKVSARGARQNVDGWGDDVTDKNGYYKINRLRKGIYNVALDLSENQLQSFTAPAVEVSAESGAHAKGKDFDLIPGAVIEGTLLNQDGTPRQGTVGIYGPARPDTGAWVQSVHTDSKGWFRTRVPAGKNRLYCMDGQMTGEQIIEVENGKAYKVSLRVAPQDPEQQYWTPTYKKSRTSNK